MAIEARSRMLELVPPGRVIFLRPLKTHGARAGWDAVWVKAEEVIREVRAACRMGLQQAWALLGCARSLGLHRCHRAAGGCSLRRMMRGLLWLINACAWACCS